MSRGGAPKGEGAAVRSRAVREKAMALAAYAGRLSLFCGGAEPVVRLSALRLPSFKGGMKGFLEA